MATRYILDTKGNIITETLGEEVDESSYSSAKISGISSDVSSQQVFNTADFDVEGFTTNPFQNFTVTQTYEKNTSFGFDPVLDKDDQPVDDSRERQSFKPMYHFSDESGRYFAKEFEMLTGYAFEDSDNIGAGDLSGFVFQYFAEIIAMLGVMEAITIVNQGLNATSSVNTVLPEKIDLRLGNYSIVEFDVFTKYVFDVLNYPKDQSHFLSRITAFFVGFSEWLNPDMLLDWNKIIEEGSRINTGKKNQTGFMSLLGIEIPNQFWLGGLFPTLIHIVVTSLETVLNSLLSASAEKRLSLLLKKFQQEAKWKEDLFRNKKREEFKFFVSMDYYYTRFAIERMHVGLKLLNRYAYGKTYLNPNHKESSLTRVSAHRSNKKIYSVNAPQENHASGIGFSNETFPFSYAWDNIHSDNKSKKPGDTTRLRALPQLLQLSYNFLSSFETYNEPDKSIMQNFFKQPKEDRNKRKIPKELVKEIEDYLEAEYVPFYIHDVRTNEILSFHAFIESISDSFNPEYTSSSGFGRIDDVKSYVKTTRNINLSFTIAATSPTDHDFMWYQINKLVTMVYPQWSEGYMADTKDGEGKFTYPFTQVPTASPLVRIRLGDVLKSNYSRSSLSRIFGIAESNNLSSNHTRNKTTYSILAGQYITFESGLTSGKKPSYVNILEPVEVEKVKESFFDSKTVEYVKGSQPFKILNGAYKDTTILAPLEKITESGPLKRTNQDSSDYNNVIMKPFKDDTGNVVSNNPITASYESGMSRGIAGFITQLDVNYGDSNWETTRIGSKAPMLVKATINFSPIHDIVPGIDHNGMMRAPVYNVGRVNNEFFGDPHDKKVRGGGIKPAIAKYSNTKKLTEGL
tara:strand:+ start:3801 stop:6365 length:2565 start_codon:yes stop_codon:yes gene_type:complete